MLLPGIAPNIMMYGPVTQFGPNGLTPAQSSFEDGGGWFSGTSNCNSSNVTTQAFDGIHSIQMSSIAAGNMAAASIFVANLLPNQGYSVSCWFKAGTVGRQCFLWIQYRDGQNNTIGSFNAAPTISINDVTTGWTFFNMNIATPLLTNAAQMFAQVNGPAAAGENHYIDFVSVNQGAFYPT